MDSQDKDLEQGKLDEEKAVEQPAEVQEPQEEAPVAENVSAEETPALEVVEEVSAPEEEAGPQAEEASVQEEEAPAQVEEEAEPEAKEDAPQEEAAAPAPPKDAPEEKANKEEPAPKTYSTKQEILDRVKELAHGNENPSKSEVDHLKTSFYKLHLAQREEEQKAYVEAGGNPENYQVLPDELEEQFKAEMGLIKEKRAKLYQQQEQEKKENLKRKEEIIEKIKGMVTSPDAVNKAYQEFKALQQEWKEIKLVPAEKANELWRNYQLYVEQFYDLLNLNREAREYDFKKNLEAKTKLCEEAEKLAEEPDVISAFHQLQELHQQYRETGPVSKDLREEVWARFKAASTVINKKHQKHFEQLRAKEGENLEKKTALCEKVEAIAQEENKNASDWEKHTKEIIAIQAEWKTIGFAPQKMNVKIFERFRAACDDFFARKAEFFKGLKERFSENAEKKRALVEKAKELCESTDWKATSEKLIKLQKEWKTIGMVPKKLGDQLWNEFNGACNKFFEARNAANPGSRNEEHQNLSKKKDIVAQLKALLTDAKEDAQEKVQELVDQYNQIGHVPFKEKDKIYKEYHDVLDRLYKELNISVARQHLDRFRSNLKNMARRGEDAIDNERGRLMRQYEQMKSEIITYENNLGFLNASSKKGNSLIDEMNKKVSKLKEELEMVKEKIRAIDKQNREQEEEEQQ
ncbi:protein of unknown function [Prevotella sp. KH2C16]|nr:DUF349 domain-containing protein [Prevotella sp. KH2C16]SFG25829.1 protein of unknown function [Prevotella sp. KH2C16]